jgi:surfeit locus 1 family protein
MSLKNPAWRRILVLAMALVGIAVTTSLGFWQVGRGAEKTNLQAMKDRQATLAPVDGRLLGGPSDLAADRQGLLYRPFVLEGRWLAEHTIYLENRQMQGRPGFYVLTPLQLKATGVVVLVQRGWAPRSFMDRAALPEVITPAGEVQVQGHLAPWPSRLYDFGGVESGQLRQNLDWVQFKQETGLPLLVYSLVQQGSASEGLLRDWPVVATGVEKHHGYAFQWFGLSGLIALLYVWFQIVQPRRPKRPI